MQTKTLLKMWHIVLVCGICILPIAPAKIRTRLPNFEHHINTELMMCEIFTFYHLCGHVAKTNNIHCSDCIHETIDEREDGPTPRRSGTPRSRCDPASARTYLMPTLCKWCINTTEAGEYLEKNPKEQFEILRTWKASLRLERVKARAEAEEPAAWVKPNAEEDDSDDSGSAESMPFISLSEVSSSASATTSRTSVMNSESLDPGTSAAEVEEIIGRIATLRGQVLKALASVTY